MLLLSYFRIFLFSYFHLFLFPRSSYPISKFYIHIFTSSHIRMFFKKAVSINSMHSVRKVFHRREGGMKRARHFWAEWAWAGGYDMGWYGMVLDGMLWVAGPWVRLTSTQLCFLCFIFLFSYFLICIFASFLLFIFHLFILSSFILPYFIFACSHIHTFLLTQREWTAWIPSGRCFIEQKGYEASEVFLSGMSVGRRVWDGIFVNHTNSRNSPRSRE
jgi:hypothetical protein